MLITMMWTGEPVAAEEPAAEAEPDDVAPAGLLAAGELDDELEQAETATMRPSAAAEAMTWAGDLIASRLQRQASL